MLPWEYIHDNKFYIGLPIPIVAVSAAISHEYYGINDRYGLLF